MRIESKILSFNKGMIENWKQDQVSQNRIFESVLWLENYDPNLELHSIVKRAGEGVVTNHLDEELQVEIAKFARNILGEAGHPDSNEVVLGTELLRTSNPYSNKSYILFLQRFVKFGTVGDLGLDFYQADFFTKYDIFEDFPAVAVLGYVYEYFTDWVLNWYEAHKDLASYPGSLAPGTLQDFCRYGESISFVTKLLPIGVLGNTNFYTPNYFANYSRLMAPCYVYYRWDVTTKKEDPNDKFFFEYDPAGSLNIRNKTIFSRWKIKIPTRTFLGLKTNTYSMLDGDADLTYYD
jgi:hypothetical protein